MVFTVCIPLLDCNELRVSQSHLETRQSPALAPARNWQPPFLLSLLHSTHNTNATASPVGCNITGSELRERGEV